MARNVVDLLETVRHLKFRRHSENVPCGIRKRMTDGRFTVEYSRFPGYEKGADGNLAINEKQARTVRLIFGLFIEGLTPCAITKELTLRGIMTVTGQSKCNAATINEVLRNEKYAGMAHIRKTFTPDFLTKKVVKNNGQVPSYLVENSPTCHHRPPPLRWCRTRLQGGRSTAADIAALAFSPVR